MQEFNKIYVTKDYSLFKEMNGNRHINIKHLSAIKDSLDKKQLPIPIIVNENFEVFEGQHRLQALKELEKEVYFMIIENLTLEDAIQVNSIQKKWNSIDFFEHYLALKKEPYMLLKNFMDLTGQTLNVSRMFLENISPKSANSYKNFVNGNLKIEDFNRSLEIYYTHLEFAACPAFSKVLFKQALIKTIANPLYNHERMLNKLRNNAYRVTPRNNIFDYLTLLTEIYNYNTTKGNTVYFNLDI